MECKRPVYKLPKRPRQILGWYSHLQDKRGRPFNRQMQAAIFSVYQFMDKEREKKELIIPLSRVRERVATALNISKTTVDKYISRGLNNTRFESPGKDRSRDMIKRNVSDDIKEEIRELIYKLCGERRTVTVELLLDEIKKEDINFHGCQEILRRLLHDMNFRYTKRNASLVLLEQPYIRNWRKKFLFLYMKYKWEDKNFVYQDETWIFRRGSNKTNEWQDGDSRSCSIQNNDCGYRYLVCHAGGVNGFVPGAELILNTKKRPQQFDDYHGNMNGDMFHKWFQEKLLPNLREPSVIIIDNASYHRVLEEKQPLTSWKKNEIEEWLHSKNIKYNPKSIKKDLLSICRQHRKPKKYILDQIINDWTAKHKIQHTILKLPPYHYFYNPIELIWGIVKRTYDKKVGLGNDFSEAGMNRAWEESLSAITPTFWENCCLKVEQQILEDYYKEEVDQLDENILVVNSDDDDDDDDYDYDEDDDDDDKYLKCDRKRPLVQRNLSEIFASHIENSQNSITQDETDKAVDSIKDFTNDFNEELTEDNNFPDASINDWIQQYDDHEEISCGVSEKMIAKDFKALLDSAMINDKIINAYFELIGRRSGDSICIKDTFFMTNLLRSCPVINNRKKKNLFNYNMIFIPINNALHWTLCVVQLKNKKIMYYDSQGTTDTPFIAIVEQYLKGEFMREKGAMWEAQGWKCEIAKNIPEQHNGVDCGPFVCAYADYIARDEAMNFNQEDMPAIRRRIASEIINGKLQFEVKSMYHSPTETMMKRTMTMEKPSYPVILKKGKYGDLPKVTLYETASFHQGDKRFPADRANSQCTAIAAYAVAALTLYPHKISPQFLDEIIIKGDEYYCQSKRQNNVTELFLQPEELLKAFTIGKNEVFIEKFQCGEGHYSHDALKSLERTIVSCKEICGDNENTMGFLFTGHGKTVGFTVLSVIPEDFFLFNSHCVDERNCFPLKKRKEGRSRLFRCRSVEALCKLLLADDCRDNAIWQIYLIKIYH